MFRASELSYWDFSCTCEVCRLGIKQLREDDRQREMVTGRIREVKNCVDMITRVQDCRLTPDEKMLLNASIYSSVGPQWSVAQTVLPLVLGLGCPRLELQATLDYYMVGSKARALGLVGGQEVDRSDYPQY